MLIWSNGHMNDDAYKRLFKSANKYLYRYTVGKRKYTKVLTKDEQTKFKERFIYLYETLDLKLGYWGIFSIAFEGRPGYYLANHFRKTEEYYTEYYEVINGFKKLKACYSTPELPCIETIKRIVNEEILVNEKLIWILNDQIPEDIVGIANCSNTCYISVALQVMCHYEKFIKLLMKNVKESKEESPLSRIIIEIFFDLVTGKESVSIEKLLDYLSIDPFAVEDTFEFMYNIINRLYEDGCRGVKDLFYLSNNLIFPVGMHSSNFTSNGFTDLIKTFAKFPDLIIIQIEEPKNNLNLYAIPNIIKRIKYNLYGVICYTTSNNTAHYYVYLSENDKYMKLNDETTEILKGSLIKHEFNDKELIVGILLLKEGINPIKSRIISESSWSYLCENVADFPHKEYQARPTSNYTQESSLAEKCIDDKSQNRLQAINAYTTENYIPDVEEIDLEKENCFCDQQKGNAESINIKRIENAFMELYAENSNRQIFGDEEYCKYSRSHKILEILINIDKYEITDFINQIPDHFSSNSIRLFELFVRIMLAIVDIRPFFIETYSIIIIKQLNKMECFEFSFSIIMNQILSNFTIERSYFLFLLLHKLEIDQSLFQKCIEVFPINKFNIDSYNLFLPEIKSSAIFMKWLDIKKYSISQSDEIVNQVINARKCIETQNPRILPELVLIIAENRMQDLIKYIDQFNINPLEYKLETPIVNTFTIFNNRPSILQLAIMFNSQEIVEIILTKWPTLVHILDDEDFSISDYSFIFSRVEIARSLQIDFKQYNNTNMKMRYLSNSPTMLEYRTFFSTYVLSCVDEVKSRPDFKMINNLILSSKKEAENLIRLYASSNGFDIKLSTSNTNYQKFHCWKGGRIKGIKSNKCNCPFKVNLSIHKDSKTVIKIINSHHNHELDPTLFEQNLLADSTKQLIKLMISADIIPDAICRFIQNYSDITLIPKQIAKLIDISATPTEISQTMELINYMHLTGGKYYSYERCGKILAILTMTNEEITNMKYADVVYTDASSFCNRLGWKFHAITGQNENLDTILFGVLFTGTFDGQIAKWFLRTLFLDTPLGDIAKTLITDEDSSIVSILEDVTQEMLQKLNRIINNVFCAWHKTKNFKTHLNLQGELRIKALELWNSYIYHKNAANSAEAYEELIKIVPTKTKEYLLQYVIPIEEHICACAVKKFLTFGHNTTGISENFNRQSKRFLRLRFYSLLDMRKEITRITKKNRIAHAYRLEHQFINCDYIFEQLNIRMFEEPKNILIGSINKSFRLECDNINDEIIIHDNLHHISETITENEGRILCSCYKAQNYGLPCSHLIFYYREKCEGKFPVAEINERFIKKKFPLLEKPNFKQYYSDQNVLDNIPSNNDSAAVTNTSLGKDDISYYNYTKMTSEFANLAALAKSSSSATEEVLDLIKKTLDKFIGDHNGDFDATSGKGERKMRRIPGANE